MEQLKAIPIGRWKHLENIHYYQSQDGQYWFDATIGAYILEISTDDLIHTRTTFNNHFGPYSTIVRFPPLRQVILYSKPCLDLICDFSRRGAKKVLLQEIVNIFKDVPFDEPFDPTKPYAPLEKSATDLAEFVGWISRGYKAHNHAVIDAGRNADFVTRGLLRRGWKKEEKGTFDEWIFTKEGVVAFIEEIVPLYREQKEFDIPPSPDTRNKNAWKVLNRRLLSQTG